MIRNPLLVPDLRELIRTGETTALRDLWDGIAFWHSTFPRSGRPPSPSRKIRFPTENHPPASDKGR